MRPVNSRLQPDTLIVYTRIDGVDEGNVPTVSDNPVGVTISGSVQPLNLQDRGTQMEGERVQYGITRSAILLGSTPPAIGLDTRIDHVASRIDGVLVTFASPVTYRAEGRAIPPGGGMSAWTVTATRRK